MCASEGTIKRRKQIRMVLWYTQYREEYYTKMEMTMMNKYHYFHHPDVLKELVLNPDANTTSLSGLSLTQFDPRRSRSHHECRTGAAYTDVMARKISV